MDKAPAGPPFPSNPDPGDYHDLSKAQTYSQVIFMLGNNRQKITNYAKSLPEPMRSAYIDEHSLALGLPVALSKLNAMDYSITLMPVVEQAKYADAPARLVARNTAEALRQCTNFPRDPSWHGSGACANMAYVSLYATDSKTREHYKRFHEAVIKNHPGPNGPRNGVFTWLCVAAILILFVYKFFVLTTRG